MFSVAAFLTGFNSSSLQGHTLPCLECCAACAISRIKSCRRHGGEKGGREKACPVFLVQLNTESVCFFTISSSFSLPYIHYSGMR